jgi:pimeloyl-ACP methyl ester carboxylesterase
VALDLPGFGGSVRAAGPYTLKGLAAAVARFIVQRRLGRVALVGSAMGSTVAQFVALAYPELVERLVLTATSSGAAVPVAMRRTREMAHDLWRTPGAVDGFFASKAPPRDYAARFYQALEGMSFEAAYEADQSNQAWSTFERLGEIRRPVLIIQGAEDRGKSPDDGARMAARLPDAKLVVLQNAAHTPQWDQPRAFGEAMLPFLLQAQPRGLARSCGGATQKIDWGGSDGR